MRTSITITVLLLPIFLFSQVNGHAYLHYPISRNALGSVSHGICAWGGNVPCTGCPQCWNQPEPNTGCGIIQQGGAPYVFGDGGLGFKNTGMIVVN